MSTWIERNRVHAIVLRGVLYTIKREDSGWVPWAHGGEPGTKLRSSTSLELAKMDVEQYSLTQINPGAA